MWIVSDQGLVRLGSAPDGLGVVAELIADVPTEPLFVVSTPDGGLWLAGADGSLWSGRPPGPWELLSATAPGDALLVRLADRDFSAGALAKAMAMSPRTLQLRMVEHDLPAPHEWLRNLRVERAEALLRSGAAGSAGDAAAAVGMDRAYFSRVYAARTGRPPSEDLR